MKSVWWFIGWFAGNAFGQVDLQTYDGCLGERVVYNCTGSFIDPPSKNVLNAIYVGVYRPGSSLPTPTEASSPIFPVNGSVILGNDLGVELDGYVYNISINADPGFIVTYTTILTTVTNGTTIFCNYFSQTEEYTISITPSSPPEMIILSFKPTAIQFDWVQADPECIKSQSVSFSQLGHLPLTVTIPTNIHSLAVEANKFSSGNYSFVVTAIDREDNTLVSDPFRFVLELPAKPDLEGELASLNDSYAELMVNWTADPVFPELTAFHVTLNGKELAQLPAENTSWSLVVEQGQQHHVGVFGENWLGNGSVGRLLLKDTSLGNTPSPPSNTPSSPSQPSSTHRNSPSLLPVLAAAATLIRYYLP